ncbi:MAG: hypothetical protein K2X87_33030 [Gemmataceae bacterium]|nr:hypothetical protein [Gemmataceae bacterium]
MTADAPAAADDRFDQEGDWIARQFLSDADLRLTPEEYVARHAHEWGCFSYHLYPYRDPVLGTWVRRVGELLSTDGEVERCRAEFLTPAELAEVRRQEAEGF